jgi:UDP-glucose 4-epimerase
VDVVVTGGAGFIGSHVCRTLRGSGDVERLTVLDDLSTGSASNLAGLDDVELVEGTVLDDRLVTSLVAGAGAVVHLAAVPAVARSLKDPRASHDANATGTVVVLEAARSRGTHVVVASSSSVYGRGVTLPTTEDHPTRPVSPYAASKLATESYALAYARSFGLPVLAFRFFNVFGPLQRADHAYAAVIPAFVDAALAGRPLTIHGDGTQTRDFTYVGDVTAVIAEALAGAVTADTPVNLAFGSRTSLLTLVSELESLLGTSLPMVHGPLRAGDVPDSQADSTRLRSLFPGVAPTALRDGLRATVEWFSTFTTAENEGAVGDDQGRRRPEAVSPA